MGRSGSTQPDQLLAVEKELAALHDSVKILFLDAPDDVLIHRFEGNRRRHPFPGATLADSIATERALLASIRDAADLVFDTGPLNANQLRSRIVETFTETDTTGTMRVSLVSFGYANGIPRDVDLVFDCRFLPNPYWVEELRPLSGLDEPVAAYVLGPGTGPALPARRRGPARVADPGVRQGGQVLPVGRRGLHRGPSPLGRHRRGDPPAPQPHPRRLPPRHRPMRVVAVGGGHGTAVSLRALARVSDDVTGVVSVADDGGSTGRLRAMLNVAAVGDLRKCLGALADPGNPLTASFEHRFAVGELAGHAVGNLLLVGLIDATGDLEESVRAVAQVMGVRGTIVPASCEGVVLVATTEEGDTRGQSDIARSSTIRRIAVEPTNAAAPTAAVEALERADLILIGPGSLFTSVLAACVIPGVLQALAGTRATKVYVANLRPQVPETAGFDLQDHVDALARHGVSPDVVLVDAASPFATQSCSLRRRVLDVSGENGLVHDVQKLAQAVTALAAG